MIAYKEYIASTMIGKKARFVCDCIVKLDVTGVIVGYEMSSQEIIYIIDRGDKQIKLGENTPKLQIEIL